MGSATELGRWDVCGEGQESAKAAGHLAANQPVGAARRRRRHQRCAVESSLVPTPHWPEGGKADVKMA